MKSAWAEAKEMTDAQLDAREAELKKAIPRSQQLLVAIRREKKARRRKARKDAA